MLLRFNKHPNDLPSVCPASGCHEDFNPVHADICRKGGVVNRRHDYIKVILAKFAEKAFGVGSTVIEPLIGILDPSAKEMISGITTDDARADVSIRNLMSPYRTTYIDVCVISPVCVTNKSYSVAKSISNAENRKINSYQDRVQKQLGGDFLPCCMSSGGVLGPSAKKIINLIVNKLVTNSRDNAADLKREIKSDISMSLVKSRVQGLDLDLDLFISVK